MIVVTGYLSILNNSKRAFYLPFFTFILFMNSWLLSPNWIQKKTNHDQKLKTIHAAKTNDPKKGK
jgi:hypothetical protein